MIKDDIELINNTLSGDDTAFNSLVQKHQKNIHAIAWQKIGDYHIAEEITQDVFLQAYHKLSTLKDPNKFDRWLYVITKRHCTNWLERKKPSILSLDAADKATLDKSALAHYVAEQHEKEATEHYREVVNNLLEKLSDKERTVIILYYLREMSYKEISKFLNVSISAIKSRLRRARQRLKEEELMICETLGSIQPPIDLTDHIFCDSMEFKADTPYFQDEHTEYTGPQTVKALMSAFDTEFDSSMIKVKVGIIGGKLSSLTTNEVDKRYSRTEWLQLILDNGLTIENFMHYASCLSKRHILAFLEDNPDFQKVDLFGISAQDDWNKYQTGFLSRIVDNEKMVREQEKQRNKDEVTSIQLDGPEDFRVLLKAQFGEAHLESPEGKALLKQLASAQPKSSDLEILACINGKPVPDIALTNLSGKPMKLEEFRSKFVLMNFSSFDSDTSWKK